MIKKFVMALSLLAVSCSQNLYADVSVGAGYQYGGALGVKYSQVHDKHIVYASAGLIGAALGYQYVISSDRRHTVGFAVGGEVLTSEKGFLALTYNYFSENIDQSGWTFGGSIGVRRTDVRVYDKTKLDIFGTEEVESKGLVGIHLGYRF